MRAAAEAVRQAIAPRQPTVALVLGSGLGFVAGEIENAVRIPYARIPGFPQPTVQGHAGELVAGTLEGKMVLAQSGRFHLYEGHAPEVVALPIRVFATLGVRTLVVTNAAGGIRRTFRPGTLMLIADQINFTGRQPLAGPVMEGEERFPDMSDPYDGELRALARKVAAEERIAVEEGTYAGLLGPSYESKAEIEMLKRIGADAVGMSTVAEVIVARARGIRCIGISTVTNLAAGLGGASTLSHHEVLETAERVKGDLARLVRGIVRKL
ncbi:MAG: purine-nucleoside phosphorylase [Gemmatimonadetes bacterium 21-71-4]|nr:MAG: purine-nucleoside phosphorylase [Gemmatimonadetes bacterium 21-71-4]